MHKQRSFRATSRLWTDDAVHAARSLAGRRPGVLQAYERLLHHVRQRTTLLSPARDPRRVARTPVNVGLLALAVHHADWLRPPEAWEPPDANPYPAFASLASHLFALYPVPGFMTSAWLQVPLGEPHSEQHWYKHLGLGNSIRTAGLPLPFTRAMGHHFLQAPQHFSVTAALRWGQVRGLGGCEALARAVVATQLGRGFANEAFWLTALRFFAGVRMDPAQVGPVVDFLQHQRFETQEAFVQGRGVVEQPPPQPLYSLRGRTLASVLRQVEQWHEELRREEAGCGMTWPPSGIAGFCHLEGTEQRDNVRCWTVRELLSSRQLFLEGQALRHCVASYARLCLRRRTTIWSLRLDVGRGPHRVLTIEVDPATRRVCQARGNANRLPRGAERAVLELWAQQAGLHLAEPC